MAAALCGCGCGCGTVISPAGGRLYVDARHKQRAYRERTKNCLAGPFWAGYRALTRPPSPRRRELRGQLAASR